MNRAEAIQTLRKEKWQPEPGLPYEISKFEPGDAWGVARCYYEVYGEEYPVDTFYIPEKLVEESESGNLSFAVARTSKGEIIGCGALFRSSCPHPRVFEGGGVIVAHAYRGGTITRELSDFVMNQVVPGVRPLAIFSESVCHHMVTQRMGVRFRFIDCTIEVGAMPAEAYPRDEFATDRVSLVWGVRGYEEQQHRVYLPERYREQILSLLDGLEYPRSTCPCAPAEPTAAETELHHEYFGFAQVARMNVPRVGNDFQTVFQACESEMLGRGARVLQFCLNLGEAAVERAVECLRKEGYFFGGILPHWFGSDGLHMQKVLDMPDFRSIKLYTKRARRILELVQQDLDPAVGKS